MASRELERIRNAILDQKYTLSEHAYDEMAADNLDVLDVESAILTGDIDKTLTMDPAAHATWSSERQPINRLLSPSWFDL